MVGASVRQKMMLALTAVAMWGPNSAMTLSPYNGHVVRGPTLARSWHGPSTSLFRGLLPREIATLRLRGGTDIKWTPGDDKPNAPFSKRARDEQARAEGRDPDAPPPEGWSLLRLARCVASAISEHPREAATLVAATSAGYVATRIRNKLRQDWPVTIKSSSPYISMLKPQGVYLKTTLLPHFRALELISPRDTPLSLPPILKCDSKDKGLEVPGYSVFEHRVRVGCGAEDMSEACSAVRAWRMADAVEGMTAVVTRKGVGGIGGVGDTVVIMTRTSLAYVSQPWRVVHCDEPWTRPPEPNVGGASEEAKEEASGEAGKGASSGRVWTLVCAALDGCSMDGEVCFTLEWDKSEQGGRQSDTGHVWLHVTAVTKRAGSASLVLHSTLLRMLRQSLLRMSEKLGGIIDTQKDMRLMRQRRGAELEAANDEARAGAMVEQVLRQQAKLDLQPNQWKRSNVP